mmetsp:Transcript_3498/g.8257  ORF Transcript_3498/g.8257 Transcript_3498/m.8257 type:complete len:320 (+) Transcript_3498:1831-2790(+)
MIQGAIDACIHSVLLLPEVPADGNAHHFLPGTFLDRLRHNLLRALLAQKGRHSFDYRSIVLHGDVPCVVLKVPGALQCCHRQREGKHDHVDSEREQQLRDQTHILNFRAPVSDRAVHPAIIHLPFAQICQFRFDPKHYVPHAKNQRSQQDDHALEVHHKHEPQASHRLGLQIGEHGIEPAVGALAQEPLAGGEGVHRLDGAGVGHAASPHIHIPGNYDRKEAGDGAEHNGAILRRGDHGDLQPGQEACGLLGTNSAFLVKLVTWQAGLALQPVRTGTSLALPHAAALAGVLLRVHDICRGLQEVGAHAHALEAAIELRL